MINAEELGKLQEERWHSGAIRYRKKAGFVDVGFKKSMILHKNEGYILTVSEMCNMLSASRSWVEKNVVPVVKHIYLPNPDAQLYYSIHDFWRFWRDNAKAYIQKLPQIKSERKRFVSQYITKRTLLPWIEIPLPQDEDNNYKIGLPVKEYVKITGRSRESILRRFFATESVKIIFCGKVYWVSVDNS